MRCSRTWITRPALAAAIIWASAAGAPAQDAAMQTRSAGKIPVEKIPQAFRNQVRDVIGAPTLFGRGPAEAFAGQPDVYSWLLDHPDRGVMAWRRLGAQCSDVKSIGNGCFGWTDGKGSEIHWNTVY